MSRKRITASIVLVVILIVVGGVWLLSSKKPIQKGKNEIKTESFAPGTYKVYKNDELGFSSPEQYLQHYKLLLKEIREDIINVCAGKEKLNIEINEENIIEELSGYVRRKDISNMFKSLNANPIEFRVNYYRKDYSVDSEIRLPVAMRIIIHPDNAVFYENNMGSVIKRNIQQEREKMASERTGKHHGDVYIFGFEEAYYYVEYIGKNKVKYYDYSGKRGEGRIYQIYVKNHSVLIWCMNNYYEGGPIGKYHDSSDEYYWPKWFRSYLNEIERMISTI